MSKKAVVFSANLSYMEKLETAMKSLCAHQDQLKIYVLNEDLPTEWFTIMNQRLRKLDSEVINCRMSPEQFSPFRFRVTIFTMQPISVTLFQRWWKKSESSIWIVI